MTIHGYAKAQRLRKKAEYDAVFANAERSYCRLFTVLYRPNTIEQSRLGIICGRKIHKRAHERNRLKRLCRESFRQSDRVRHFAQPVDMIVLPKVAAVMVKNTDIAASLAQHWQRIDRRLSKQANRSNQNNPQPERSAPSQPTNAQS